MAKELRKSANELDDYIHGVQHVVQASLVDQVRKVRNALDTAAEKLEALVKGPTK
jgi:hypothetical protein